MPPMVYRDGEFIACEPLTEFEDYWFAPPLGLLPMHLSLHSEVATLPISFSDKGMRECFFKINYWGMAPETVEKVKVLADFGLCQPRSGAGRRGNGRAPRSDGGPDGRLRAAHHCLSGSAQERAARLGQGDRHRGQRARDGKTLTYRLGTLTVKGALPTGVAPSIAAQWLAEGRIEPGVYPPEIALDPETVLRGA